MRIVRFLRRPGSPALLVLGLGLGLACGDDTPRTARGPVPGGDPERGRQVITESACGVCHTIPGVRGARGLVGPPLTKFGRRSFIAGHLPNTPDNLVLWVLHPQQIDPRTAMPSLGLDEGQARDVAADLYQLD